MCPSTDSTYDLKTGKLKDWYPTNPVLRALTKSLRDMVVYSVKIEDYQICVDVGVQSESQSEDGAELVFGGSINVGRTATDVAVDEVSSAIAHLDPSSLILSL